ncbi:GAF domain-containing protein [Parvularcula marina]|uniref:GAF domain-containing protein n=1 Tax=Parvularcula marina TaxID=2292771 RepID=A0A371RHG7_9PROT|nr:GAF domain-containing protein [Parvularcula marina]RFB04894.1 GAF domain-containing protein [Parvularcula marina]
MPNSLKQDPYRQALQRLNRISFLHQDDFQGYLHEILRVGRDIFQSDNGFCSQITGDIYHVFDVVGDSWGIRKGDNLPLKDTLCATIISSDKPLALDDLSGDDASCHPALPADAFGSYIGVPLLIDGALFGTLSFASKSPRKIPFTEDDIELISLMATGISSGFKLKKTAEMLRFSNEQMQLILDNIPARIWFKDDKNRILKANRAAAQSMGFSNPTDLENADTYELFPKQAAKYHADDLEVLDSGNAYTGIIERYTPDGMEEGWISTDKIPLRLEDGRRALLVVSMDITDQVANGYSEETPSPSTITYRKRDLSES